MSRHPTIHERLVLDVLRRSDSLTIEQLIVQLPELSWSALFHAVDSLSRKDAITLKRIGFDYELRARPSNEFEVNDFIAKSAG